MSENARSVQLLFRSVPVNFQGLLAVQAKISAEDILSLGEFELNFVRLAKVRKIHAHSDAQQAAEVAVLPPKLMAPTLPYT